MRPRVAWRRTVAVLVASALTLVAAPGAAGAPTGAADDEQQVALVAGDGQVQTERVSADEAAALEATSGRVVTRGRTAATEMAQSVPFVGAPAFWGLGHRGAGKVIAVVDTGVDPGFGGTIVGQACFAATQQGSTLVGHCGPGRDQERAYDPLCFDLGLCGVGDVLDADAGRPCESGATTKACAHGTAVAAVAARTDAPLGVAPDAGVYAIQVFNPTGTAADFVDILLALDHIIDLADAGLPVAAVNLSLSSSATYPTHCDTGLQPDSDGLAFRAAIGALLARGIPTAVAAGNDGHVGGIGLPACVSNAIAVAASDLQDDIADFSNRSSLVDLAAPGADQGNRSVDAMEIPGNPVGMWSGTSFAAPHVAAGLVLAGEEYPSASVAQLLGHLRSSGPRARDLSTGASYPRLLLRPPAHSLPAGVLFPSAATAGGTVRGATGDFDGDGRSDVLAHAPGSAPDRIAFGTDRWALTPRAYAVGGSYAPLIGNFRGSAADDILWYAPGPAQDWAWTGSPSRTFATIPQTINGTYLPLIGDFDGDGYDDILWYGPGRSFDSLWYGGTDGFTNRSVSINGVYRVVVGDLDGDGRDDVVFHGPGAAADNLWRGTPTEGTWLKSSLSIGGTNELRTGDIDGDGDDDLLLYQAGGGADSIWRGGPGVGGSGGTGGFSPLAVSVNGTYVPSVADLDGDGRDDILWYAAGPSADFLWLGRPSGAPLSRPLSVQGTYTALLADLDADGGADITWFQPTDPSTPVWWSHTP